MKTDNKTIKIVEDFVSGIHAMKGLELQAEMEVQEVHEATMDAMHILELCETTRMERQKIATELIKHRKRRRKAKNALYASVPIKAWVEENKKALHALEQALGEARKREKASQHRIYAPRTSFFRTDSIGGNNDEKIKE